MKTIKQNQLNEVGLIVNKKEGAYPKNDNILIMAGGAGSGKSFILNKLILFDGKIFNPDDSLEMLLLYGKKKPNEVLSKRFEKEYGYPLKDVDIGNPEQLTDVYSFISDYSLHAKREAMFFKGCQALTKKPNVIFDITLKNFNRIFIISDYAKMAGYDLKNIHIVWVITDIKIALKQNEKRQRKVDSSVVKFIHQGTAQTMHDLLEETQKWSKYIDGDIWIVFNKAGVDTELNTKIANIPAKRGEYEVNVTIDKYTALHIKERGKPAKSLDEIEKPLLNKIISYVPDEVKDLWRKHEKN